MMVTKKKAPIKKKTPVKTKNERRKSAPTKEKVGESAPVVEIKFVMRNESQKQADVISDAQEFQLELIARTNFNLCNGRRVAELLRDNRRMWRAAFMPLDFISLRDLDDDCWHADTLYIYAEEGWQHSLEELVREQFQADEVHWIGGGNAVDMLGSSLPELKQRSDVILSVWWD